MVSSYIWKKLHEEIESKEEYVDALLAYFSNAIKLQAVRTIYCITNTNPIIFVSIYTLHSELKAFAIWKASSLIKFAFFLRKLAIIHSLIGIHYS